MKKEIVNKIIKYLLWTIAIYVATLSGFAFKLAGGNYIHIGDAAVYLSALVLPVPAAIVVSVIGCALADVTLSSINYIVATVIVKTLIVLAAKMLLKLSDKVLIQDVLVCLCGVITVAGYYIADVVMLLIQKNGFIASIVGAMEFLKLNIIQALVCAVVYIVISGFARKTKE